MNIHAQHPNPSAPTASSAENAPNASDVLASEFPEYTFFGVTTGRVSSSEPNRSNPPKQGRLVDK